MSLFAHSFQSDIVSRVPIFGNACSPSAPCGRLFESQKHKISGSFSSNDVYTVTATVKIWTSSGIFCSGPNCFPTGTPLRTFTLDPVQATL
jgi:hypothetical protein